MSAGRPRSRTPARGPAAPRSCVPAAWSCPSRGSRPGSARNCRDRRTPAGCVPQRRRSGRGCPARSGRCAPAGRAVLVRGTERRSRPRSHRGCCRRHGRGCARFRRDADGRAPARVRDSRRRRACATGWARRRVRSVFVRVRASRQGDAVDSRFAVAAAAGRAHCPSLSLARALPHPRHHAIPISFTRISSPCSTCSW